MHVLSKSGLRLWLCLVMLGALMAVNLAPVSAGDNNINWNELGHNSRDTLYRSPGGAVTTNTPIRLRLRALDGDLTSAEVRVWNDRPNSQSITAMTKVASDVVFTGDANHYEFWEVTLPASALPTIYWYRFIAHDGTATAYYEDDEARTGGWGQTYGSSEDRGWQLTIYDPAFSTPDWVKNGIIYQIFVDRFRDGDSSNNPTAGDFFYGEYNTLVRSNDTEWNTPICDPRAVAGALAACANGYSNNFYGGDLQGVIDQLDYLEDLGVTVLYLNPIFESPSNHKYDTFDFMQIDDNFGDLALFQTLTTEAHARGINIVLDGVFNHTSSDSIYFDRYSRWDGSGNPTTVGADDDSGACESTASTYADWFNFNTGTGCSDGRGYESWFNYDSLPKLNAANGEVRDYFINNGLSSVAPYWMQWADGWRLDVGGDLDQGTTNSPDNNYWEDFRTAVHAVNSDAYIVGEEWGNASSWTLGGEWDATMNYQFSSAALSFMRSTTTFVDNDHNSGSSAGTLAPIGPSGFNERILNLEERYAPEAFQAMMNLFGSHDTQRVLFMLDENTTGNNTAQYTNPTYDWSGALARLKGAVLLQMTMPGAPTIYYGDEVGTINPPSFDGSSWQDDPYNRVPFPWLDEDGTPFYTHMQSSGTQDAIRDYYTALTTARNAHPALRTGSLDPLLIDDANGVYVYGRQMADDSDTAIVVVNKTGAAQNVTVDVSGYLPFGSTLTNVLAGGTVNVSASGEFTVSAPAHSGSLLVLGSFSGRPAEVSDLNSTSGNGTIDLTWSAVANADVYEIYRSRLSGGGYEFVNTASSTNYSDTGLTNAQAYHYVVVVRSDDGLASEFSNEETGVPAISLSGAWYNTQWPPTMNHVLSAVDTTDNIYGKIWIDGVTSAPGATAGLTAQVGYGPQGDEPTENTWTWFPTTFNAQSGNDDEYVGTLLPTSVGTFYYAYRYSTNGGANWVYGDFSGPHTVGGTNFGVLTVVASGDTTAPAAPTNLVLTGTTSVSVSLAWDAHPNTDADLYGFEIWRENVASPGFSKVATVVDTAAVSYTDSSLTSDETYNYYVKAIDTSLNASDASNTVQATAEMLLVDVTFNVDVPAYTPGTVYIAGDLGTSYPTWNPGGVPLTQVDSDTWSVTLTILDGTALQFKFARGDWDRVEKQADGSTEVDNRMATVTYGVDGTQTVNSTVANWRDPFVTAVSPVDDATGVANTTNVQLTWNQAMPSTLTGFTLTGPSGTVSGTYSYDSGTFTHTFDPATNLPGGSYTATVANQPDAANDPQKVSTTWDFTVTGGSDVTPPEAPTGLQSTGHTITSVGLSWDTHPDTAGDLAGFVIYREAVSGGGYSSVGTVIDPAGTSYNDTSASPGTEYNYVVKAIDEEGNESTASNVVNVTTDALTEVAVTFQVTVPNHTVGTVYLVGGFGGAGYPDWNPGGIALTETATADVWEVTLNLDPSAVYSYKYTRGSWETVEKEANGNSEILGGGNRSVMVTNGSSTQTVTDSVLNWRDPYIISISPADGATSIPAAANIITTWNQDVDDTPVSFTVTGPSGEVTGAFSFDSGTDMLTFNPDTDLADGSYTVTSSTNVDAGGDTQQVAFSSSFTVSTAPAQTATVAFSSATQSSPDESANSYNVSVTLTTSDGGTLVNPITVDVTNLGTGSASGSDYSFSTATLTFSAGSANGSTQSASLTVTADTDDESDETVNLGLSNLTGTNASLGSQTSTTFTITDDDTAAPVPGVNLSRTTITIRPGQTRTYTVVLTSQPTGNVAIAMTQPQRCVVRPRKLTFTTSNWNVPQTVNVTVRANPFPGTRCIIRHTATGGGYNGVSISNVTINIPR